MDKNSILDNKLIVLVIILLWISSNAFVFFITKEFFKSGSRNSDTDVASQNNKGSAISNTHNIAVIQKYEKLGKYNNHIILHGAKVDKCKIIAKENEVDVNTLGAVLPIYSVKRTKTWFMIIVLSFMKERNYMI